MSTISHVCGVLRVWRILGVRALVIFMLAILTSSCTRTKKDASQLKIAFSSEAMKQSASQVVGIAFVNVSGPGINGVITSKWENPCKHGGPMTSCDPTVYEPFFQLDVLKGDGRLVQVLAVLEDISSAGSGGGSSPMIFYYGDQTASFNQDFVALDIPISRKGGAAGQGQFSGRLLNAAGVGVTGQLGMFFRVEAGKPSMLVDELDIFGGWVDHLTVLKGASFDLKYMDEGTLLASDLSLDGVTTAGHILTPGPNLMVLSMPATYQWWGGSSMGWSRGPEINLVGTAGGGVSTAHRVCYDNTGGPIQNLYTDATHTTPVNWNGNNTSDPASIYVMAGGFASSNTTLATDCGAPGVTLKFNKNEIASSTSYAIGVKGPFAMLPSVGNQSGSNFVKVSTTGGTSSVEWDYAPMVNTGPNPIEGVTVFAYTNSAGSQDMGDLPFRIHGMGDGYDCEGLADGLYGTTLVGDYDINTKSAAIPAVLSGVLNNTSFILCPFRSTSFLGLGRQYFQSAVQSYGGMGGGAGGGGCMNCGGPQIAEKIILLDYNKTAALTMSAYSSSGSEGCVPFYIEGQMNDGSPAPLNGSMQLAITSSGFTTAPEFYRYPDCSSNSLITGPLSLNMSYGVDGKYAVFVKSTGPGSGVITVNETTAPIPAASMTVSFVSGSANGDKLVLQGPSQIIAHSCQPILFRTDIAATGYPYGAPMSTSVTLPVIAGLQFYKGPMCNSGEEVGRFTIHSVNTDYFSPTNTMFGSSPNRNFIFLYMKYIASSPTLAIQPTAPMLSAGVQGLSANVIQPGAPTNIQIQMFSSVNSGSCQMLSLRSVDSSFHPSPLAAAQSLVMADSGGGIFYPSPGCLTGGQANLAVPITSGQTESFFYYRNNSPALTSGTISIQSGTSLISQPMNYQLQEPVADHFAVVMPGQSYSTDGTGIVTITGTPWPLKGGVMTNPITIMALTPFNKLAGQFNFSYNSNFFNSQPAGGSYMYYNAIFQQSMITFAGGLATVQMTPNMPSFTGPFAVSFGGNMTPGIVPAIQPVSIQVAAKFEIYTIPSALAVSNCRPMMVTLEDPVTGNTFAPMSMVNANFSPTGTYGPFSDPGCTTSITSLPLLNTNPAGIFYYKPYSVGATSLTASSPDAPMNPGTDWNGNFSASVTSQGAPISLDHARISGRGTFQAGSCQAMMLNLEDTLGQAVPAGASTTINLTDTSSGGGFYADANCTTTINSKNILTGESAALIYYKRNSVNSSFNIQSSGADLTTTFTKALIVN